MIQKLALLLFSIPLVSANSIDENINTLLEEETFLPYYALQAATTAMVFFLSIPSKSNEYNVPLNFYIQPAATAFAFSTFWEFSKLCIQVLFNDVEWLGITENLTTVPHIFINIMIALTVTLICVLASVTSTSQVYFVNPWVKIGLFLVYFCSTFLAAEYSMCSDLSCTSSFNTPWGIYIFIGANAFVYMVFSNRIADTLLTSKFLFISSLLLTSLWYRWYSSLLTLGLHAGATLLLLPLTYLLEIDYQGNIQRRKYPYPPNYAY